ncbi:phospholipid carrier-dependent glycosyltransferase [Candidatus Woesearchaeota archaeon]|nr:phospholipid carrier-dependent glycosyltransferase [Candidatus Woesearchaeota archaeon]
MKERYAYYILGTFMLILLITQFIGIPQTLIWDEAAFLGNARDVYGDSNYTEWFRNPLPSVIYASTWLVTGESVLAARLTSALFGMLALLLTYLIARKHTTNMWALIVAGIVLANEQFIFWSGFAYGEIIALTFLLLGIYALEKEKKWFYGLSGLAFGLAFLTRFANALIIVIAGSYLLFLAWQNKKITPVISYGLGIFIVVFPWLLRNMIHYGTPFWDVFEQGRTIAAYTTTEPLLPFIITLISLCILPIIIITAGVVNGKGKRKQIVWTWWASLVVFIILHCVIIRLKLPRYSLALVPFLIVIMAHEIGRIKPKKAMATIIITLLVLTAIMQGAAYAERKDALLYCDELIPLMNEELGRVFAQETEPVLGSNVWVHYGYLQNINSRALFTNNWTLYEEKVHPTHIIYADETGHEYDLSILEQLEVEGTLEKQTSISMDCGSLTLWKVRRE